MYDTGARVSELLNLPEGNVNFDSGQIKVIGKGKKERTLFMSSKVYKALFKYARQYRSQMTSDCFFTHKDGRPLTRFYFAHRMHEYVKKAGITTVCTPHILRYSYAIQFIRNGGDERTLQSILGHATMEMTRHYAKIAYSDVEKKMKEFSPVALLNIQF